MSVQKTTKNVNKTASILKAVSHKKVITQSEILAKPALLELFSDTTSTTPKRRLIDTVSLLAKKGYLSCGSLDGEKVYKITIKGEQQIKKTTLREDLIENTRFNGRFYLVSFEIPESQKVVRNAIITCLKHHGFINYQKGLWILPYNPSKLIEALRVKYQLTDEIRLIVAVHLDNEAWLKKQFKI